MVWTTSEIFTKNWVQRAERIEKKDFIDIGDKFISLWIAFNGWMRGKYGEDVSDINLITTVKNCKEMKNQFDYLQKNNKIFQTKLVELKKYTISNMRYPENKSRTKKFDGSYESLFDVLYQIRCNLFHGRKDPTEDKKDFELVNLAFYLLHPLFVSYLNKYGYY
jgi:hypothetical protein